jgi:hypothetical protein
LVHSSNVQYCYFLILHQVDRALAPPILFQYPPDLGDKPCEYMGEDARPGASRDGTCRARDRRGVPHGQRIV